MNPGRIVGAIAFVAVLACVAPGGVRTAHAQSILELDAIVVEGRIQRPQASYIIKRASIDFGIQAKRQSFVDRIVESIEGDPF